MMQLEIYDADDVQYLPAARGLKFSKAWQGGEDLSLSFVLDRPGDRDWPDVGYGHGVIFRHGLAALWEGEMRGIDQGKDEIAITAVGQWAILSDYVYIGADGTKGRLWCDTRYGKWKPVTSDVSGSSDFMLERFQMDTENRLYCAARKNENFGNSPMVRGGLYYICNYDDIKRVTFNYDVALQTDWSAILTSYASGWTSPNTEWSVSTTGSSSADVTLTTERPILVFQIRKNAANADYTGETGALYMKITSLKVYGTAETTPTVTDVANDIVDQLQAGTDIENDKTDIETINLALEPLFYEDGEKCLDALEDAASFGDASNKAIYWGVDDSKVFVKAPDRDAVRYVVPAEACRELSAKGGTHEGFVTEAWGSYVDEEGVTQYTAKYYAHVTTSGIVANTTSTGDDLASTVYGVKRDAVIPFGRVSSTLAVEFLKQYLIEHGHPQVTSSFEVIGEVQDLMRGGAEIQPFEMEPGYLVQIPHFRAVEAEGASGVDLREWDTTFMLAGLQWDDDRGVAKLIPEGAPEDLQRLIEFARRFRQQEEHDAMAKRIRVLGM